MLPLDPAKAREALLRWTMGDTHAADFLAQIAEIARLADDIVDELSDRQKKVCWLLVRTLVALPRNPFFAAHGVTLGPVMMTIIAQWEKSDEWRFSSDPLKQTHGFVIREGIGNLVHAVAAIVGGYDHAVATVEDFFQTCHAGSTETVSDWVKE